MNGNSAPHASRLHRALAPCPDRPNCVCSENADLGHHVLPLTYACNREEAFDRLVALVGAMPRSAIITADGFFLHATFTSRFFRFVDDLECLIDDGRKVVHVRSSARQGYYDFGVNRARVDALRRRFAALRP